MARPHGQLELQRMTGMLSDKSIKTMQWITCAACAAMFVFCIVKTLHWQIVWDESVMRYVRFLMSRGMRPYSDITDMNMPGTYLMEALGTTIFGWSDLSWRIYEYCLIAGMAVAGMVIGGRRYWQTGVYGGTIFLLVRFAEGERVSMERNEVMALLQLAGMAFFFVAMRRRKPVPFGVCCALITMTATMKPWAFLLEIFLITLLIVTLKREGVRLRGYLLWAGAGTAMVLGVILIFMVREHALGGFAFIMLHVWPLFKKISPHDSLAAFLIPRALVPMIGLAAYAAYKNRGEMQWQRWALMLGMLAGAISFKLEGSRWGYHRYVFMAFLAMWMAWELVRALDAASARSRVAGVMGLAVLLGLVCPYYLLLLHKWPVVSPQETYSEMLQTDLTTLGGAKLQGQVECLEMLEGCLRTLYEMRLVQNTGSTGDLLLFTPNKDAAVSYYQKWYMDTQERHPADVVVLGNFWFQGEHTFHKIDYWPEYAAYLHANYVQFDERRIGPGNSPGYQIYLRRGSDVEQRAREPGGGPTRATP